VLHRPVEPGRYTSRDYAALAGDLDVRLSVGRTGQCWDNALAQSFFASLKGEALDHRPWPTRASVRREIVAYIAWFNGTRLHRALGYLVGVNHGPFSCEFQRRSAAARPHRLDPPGSGDSFRYLLADDGVEVVDPVPP
jgi:transposase InsO family protein